MKTASLKTWYGVPKYHGVGRKNARKKICIVGSRQVPSTYKDDMVHIFCEMINIFKSLENHNSSFGKATMLGLGSFDGVF